MPDSILSADPASLNRSAIRKRLRTIAEVTRAARRNATNRDDGAR